MTTLFCIDFDETLSNTDRLRAELLEAIRQLGGKGLATAYQEAYEAVREKHGVPRMPLILQAAAEQAGAGHETHRQLAELFHAFPYGDYIYPGAEQAILHLKQRGHVVLFSDGDAFFQSQKIYATRVAALASSVIILPKKTDYFDELAGFWPAEHYVFIDDKQKVLDAAKNYFGEQATTVLVRQGRYADASVPSTADMNVTTIAEVVELFPL